MNLTDGPVWTPPSELAEQLYDLYQLRCPPMWGPPRRPYFKTYGPHIAKVMTALGVPPMPHQRYIADVATEIDPDTGYFAYREVDLSIMRQQGKTALMLGIMIHRLRAFVRNRILYSAQTRNDARDRLLEEFLPAVESGPQDLARQFRARKGLGQESIVCTSTRSRVGIIALREDSGHGPFLDLGLLDEAFSHVDSRIEEAMSPAMLTRLMAQLWVASAAGTEKSTYWNAKRERGRELIERLWGSGLTQWPSICYMEWFAPDWMPRDDPATWWFCMPALGHTITEQVVKAELEKLGPDEFDRGMLNRTKKSRPPADTNVPTAEWPECLDADSQLGNEFSLAFDITPDRKIGSIVAVGPRPDGLLHTEIVDRRPGTAWMVPRLVELRRRWRPIAIGVDDRGPAAALLDELAEHGIRKPLKADDPARSDLVVTNAQEMARACGQFADAVRNGILRHIGQSELDAALAGARTRHLGDTWGWGRRAAEVDISPLVAATLARYAHLARVELVRDDYDLLGSIPAMEGQCPYCDAWSLDGPISHYDDCPTLRKAE
jgi:hypothetical protein